MKKTIELTKEWRNKIKQWQEDYRKIFNYDIELVPLKELLQACDIIEEQAKQLEKLQAFLLEFNDFDTYGNERRCKMKKASVLITVGLLALLTFGQECIEVTTAIPDFAYDASQIAGKIIGCHTLRKGKSRIWVTSSVPVCDDTDSPIVVTVLSDPNHPNLPVEEGRFMYDWEDLPTGIYYAQFRVADMPEPNDSDPNWNDYTIILRIVPNEAPVATGCQLIRR